ncbi:hypothetical protein [Streptosporangium sp. NPDC001681]
MSTAPNGQKPQAACEATEVARGVDPRLRNEPLVPHDQARPSAGRVS